MTKKATLLMSIVAFILCVCFAITGVYAVSYSKIGFVGDLTTENFDQIVFIENATIKNHSLTNGEDPADSEEIENLSKLYIGNEKSSLNLNLNGYSVESGQTAEIVLKTRNLTDQYIKTNVEFGTLPEGIIVRNTSLYMPKNHLISSINATPKNFTVYITNNSTTTLDLSTLNLTVTLQKYSSVMHTAYKADGTTVDYHYVEMGTIPGETSSEYLKWRFISVDGETKYTGSKPNAIFGYYILETDTTKNTSLRSDGKSLTQVCFNNDFTGNVEDTTPYRCNSNKNAKANDYYYSTVRKYLTGTKVYKNYSYDNSQTDASGNKIAKYTPNTSSHYSDMFSDFCIDKENDFIYSMITGRTLNSLYSKIYSSSGSALPSTANYAPSLGINMNTTDKFWLPSHYEVINLGISQTWGSTYSSGEGTTRGFWYRSPTYPLPHGAYVTPVEVTENGSVHTTTSLSIFHNYLAVRPAFKI